MDGRRVPSSDWEWVPEQEHRMPHTDEVKTRGSAQGGTPARTARYDEKLSFVLSASAALFAQKGYERTTIRDVSQATHMSLAGLYYYFKNKEELLFLIQHRTFDSLISKLQSIIKEEPDPRRCLHKMITMHFAHFIQHMDDLKICSREIESLRGGFFQKVAERRMEYFELTKSIFDRILEQTGHADVDSRLVVLYLFGTLNWIYQWYRPGRYPGAEEMADQLTGIYLNGFLRSPGTWKPPATTG